MNFTSQFVVDGWCVMGSGYACTPPLKDSHGLTIFAKHTSFRKILRSSHQ